MENCVQIIFLRDTNDKKATTIRYKRSAIERPRVFREIQKWECPGNGSRSLKYSAHCARNQKFYRSSSLAPGYDHVVGRHQKRTSSSLKVCRFHRRGHFHLFDFIGETWTKVKFFAFHISCLDTPIVGAHFFSMRCFQINCWQFFHYLRSRNARRTANGGVFRIFTSQQVIELSRYIR